MEYLMSFARSRARDLPLRPLLYAGGAAGTAAGFYYFLKRSRGDKRKEGQAQPTLSQDPVQTESVSCSSTDPSLMSDMGRVPVTHADSTVPKDSLAEIERRHEKLKTQLEKKISYLKTKENVLQEDLSLSLIQCKTLMREHEQGQLHLAEAERKYKQAMESNAQLEQEKSDLTSEVATLQSSVQQLEEELCETYKQSNEIRNSLVEAEMEYEHVMFSSIALESENFGLKHNICTLHVSVQQLEEMVFDAEMKCNSLNQERVQEKMYLAEAEKKYKEAMESNAQLEKEKSDLTSQVDTLQSSVQQMKEELSETHTICDEVREHEQGQVHLAEAERKYKQAMESNAQLEKEKSDLTSQVATLHSSVQQLEELVFDAEMKCNSLKQEREQEKVYLAEAEKKYKEMISAEMEKAGLLPHTVLEQHYEECRILMEKLNLDEDVWS